MESLYRHPLVRTNTSRLGYTLTIYRQEFSGIETRAY